MAEQTDKNSMNKAPKVYDLAILYRVGDEVNLAKALDKDTFNLRIVAACLRRLADGQIPPDIVRKLADYLDPDIEKPRYKEGPKPKEKRSWMYGHQVIGHYNFLCNDRELARFALNSDNEAFFLVENSELWDAEGNFAPQWKYPHRMRDRELVSFPKKGKIEDYICKIFNICNRTFADLRAAYRK